MTQSAPKVPTLADPEMTVTAPCPRPALRAQPPARLTSRVDSTSPVRDSAQNGRTSASERRPDFFHTQRRLSSKDGTVPAAVATRFAHPGFSVRE